MNQEQLDKFNEKFTEFRADGTDYGAGLYLKQSPETVGEVKEFIAEIISKLEAKSGVSRLIWRSMNHFTYSNNDKEKQLSKCCGAPIEILLRFGEWNPNCTECHTKCQLQSSQEQVSEGWEKRYDKISVKATFYNDQEADDKAEMLNEIWELRFKTPIKDFIRKEIQAAEERGYERGKAE